VANAIEHRGAVRVLDDDVDDDGSAFLMMELLLGETLDDRARRSGGRLPEREVVALAHQLLDVLAAAHAPVRRPVPHRAIVAVAMVAAATIGAVVVTRGPGAAGAGARGCHVLATPASLAGDDTVWFGAMFPTRGDEGRSCGLPALDAVDLGRRDFDETVGGLPPARPGAFHGP
jgi:hypothetical protein